MAPVSLCYHFLIFHLPILLSAFGYCRNIWWTYENTPGFYICHFSGVLPLISAQVVNEITSNCHILRLPSRKIHRGSDPQLGHIPIRCRILVLSILAYVCTQPLTVVKCTPNQCRRPLIRFCCTRLFLYCVFKANSILDTWRTSYSQYSGIPHSSSACLILFLTLFLSSLCISILVYRSIWLHFVLLSEWCMVIILPMEALIITFILLGIFFSMTCLAERPIQFGF